MYRNTAYRITLKKKKVNFPAYSTYVLAELTEVSSHKSEGLTDKIADGDKMMLAKLALEAIS